MSAYSNTGRTSVVYANNLVSRLECFNVLFRKNNLARALLDTYLTCAFQFRLDVNTTPRYLYSVTLRKILPSRL